MMTTVVLSVGFVLVAVLLGQAAEYVNMEEVYPVVAHQKGAADINHPLRLKLVIAQYHLNLVQNSGLISPYFVSHYEDDNGETKYIKGHLNCFYHGSVEGHPDWHVAMSTCQGLRGIFGDPGNRNDYYYIEPTTEGCSISEAHTLYRSYNGTSNTSCGSSKSGHHTSFKVPSLSLTSSRLVRRQLGGRPKIVEWALVNDNAQYQAFGENLTAVVLRDLEIANIVDKIFQPLGIRIVVVYTVTWTKGNKIEYPSEPDATLALERFGAYEATFSVEHDSTMLITGVDLPGGVGGFANIGQMCRGRLSVGVVGDGKKWTLQFVGVVAAHELGHLFNMQHDDDSPEGECSCSDSTGRCVMYSTTLVNDPPSAWSSCSMSYLMEGYTLGLDSCLSNTPQRTLEDPFCGNSIKEGSEECDCGSVEECTDKCCNPGTCKLASGAQCSVGECCTEDCRYVSHGTVCRNATSECDIAEYCIGDSENCPRDVYKQDTSPCNEGENYCFSGQCPSSDAQCQLYFGTRSGPPSCYSGANVLGSRRGNCGSTSTRYMPCAPENVGCGQLQCELGTFNYSLVRGLDYRTSSYTVSSSMSCNSFTLALNSDTLSLGLVQEGTKCGNESMCIAQACTAISSLSHIQPCPVGSNSLTCAGAGVCNNLNECSCVAGFVGSTCEEKYSSGKLSGGEIAGLFFGFLFGFLAAGLIVGLVIFAYCRPNPTNKNSSSASRNRSSSSAHDERYISTPRPPLKTTTHLSRGVPSRPAPQRPSASAPQKTVATNQQQSRLPPKVTPSQPGIRTPGKKPPPPPPLRPASRY